MNAPLILKLNRSGLPMGWMSREETVCAYVKKQILWSCGEQTIPIVGGIGREGKRTVVNLPSIISVSGDLKIRRSRIPLENRYLFRRDRNMCLYCGKSFCTSDLSCDHVTPRAQGGKNTWMNVVTACCRCNHRKGNRTPEQAGMKLLAIPFEPNQFEFLYLANKRILADQMDFLKSGFSAKCRLSH